MRDKINRLLTTREIHKENLSAKEEKREDLFIRIEDYEEARSILQKAAQLTQEKLGLHFSSLVSLALSSVFDDPYKFKVDFVSKRGTTECDLLFIDDKGNEYQPLASSGYGAVDVASFALRIVYWSLGKTRNVLTLDEPFKHLSGNLMKKASEMIKSLSDELNLQFIIISHNTELTAAADKVFEIKQKNKHTYIGN